MMAEKVKVKSGDTMSALAAKAGVSLEAMKAANPQISNPSLIKPGQVLNVPASAENTTAANVSAQAQAMITKLEARLKELETSNAATIAENTAAQAANDKELSDQFIANEALAKDLGRSYDPKTGKIGDLLSKNGTTDTDFDVETYTKAYLEKLTEDEKTAERLSAFNILKMEFQQYGLGSLVDSISNLLTDGTPPAEFALRLRDTKEYKDRFKANEIRISKGLAALSPAEYVGLEDQYQSIMREYDLPESYYSKDKTGKQLGFEQLLGSDVSAKELESRIITAKDRVVNANPEVTKALKQFYPDITNGDILAYALDPKNALKSIQSRVTAAEIGGAAMQTGLATSLTRAEELQKYGVDKAAATEGYSMISGGLQRGSELASIYGQDPYSQATAESEVFKLTGQDKARKQRQKVTGLEKATFGGQSGVTSGALARDRAGGY
jgi:murein DD-endopeptidase MepM/ murein hydrolase activator NlpD